MDTIMNTNAELFKQLSYIADDEICMKKVVKYVKKLAVGKEKLNAKDKDIALNDFKKSLEELKSYKEGKMKFISLEDFHEELRKEGYYD